MTITVDIRPEVEAALATQAAAHGRGIDAYVAALLEAAVRVQDAPVKPANPSESSDSVDFCAPARGLFATLDWSQCPAVESVPGKVSGAWVFKDTRMPVAAVFENLEDGVTIGELTELYAGLTHEQIVAVLDFAARSLDATVHAN